MGHGPARSGPVPGLPHSAPLAWQGRAALPLPLKRMPARHAIRTRQAEDALAMAHYRTGLRSTSRAA